MDEFVNEWMNEWTDIEMNERMDEIICRCQISLQITV